MTDTHAAAAPGGRLAHVEATRGGASEHPERPMVIGHREALIYTLGKAAELEHLVMCQYLYAAFSLKQDAAEGVPEDLVPTLKGWRRELLEIGEQEMLHLALVQNLLASVGAAPRLARPNFPLPAQAYPAGVQIALLPFGEAPLRHFAFLERPEGHDMTDADEFAALAKAEELPHEEVDEIGPHLQEFATIGHLYRSIEDGMGALAERLGEQRLFIGPARAQATEAHFRRLIRMLDAYLALREANPGFDPTRPVDLAHVRPPASGAEVTVIGDGFTARCADLLNATYELILQLLSRYFANTDESPEQLATLADVAVGLMYTAVKPLGDLVTRLPVGPEQPGRTAGPALELFYDVDYLLPHRVAAWVLMEERLREIAELATRCRDQCMPTFMPILARVTDSLRKQADRLAAAG